MSGLERVEGHRPAGVEAPAVSRSHDRHRGDGGAVRREPRCSRSTSLDRGTLLTMLPFAAALAIASLGQTLVVMQGGIDLSVAGGLSLYVVIVTKYPAGDNSRLLAGDRHRVPRRGRRRLAERLPDRPHAPQPDRRDARHERVALRRRALVLGRHPDARRPPASARIGGGLWLGIPAPVYFAVAATAVVTAVVKLTPAGRRFEGVGANETAARPPGSGCKRHRTGAYVWAQLLYCLAAVLHAGIVNQPTAYEGDNYLLPTVAAVVLGGTSLLGGRGNLVATALAALFLSQLDQFVLALGVDVRDPHARPGGGARRRRRALHDRLGERSRDASPARRARERRADLNRRLARLVSTHRT